MHRFLIFLFFIFYSVIVTFSSVYAEDTVRFNIQWDAPETISLHTGNQLQILIGEKLTQRPESGMLPWFIARVDDDKSFLKSALLTEVVYDTLPLELSSRLADTDLIGADFYYILPIAEATPMLNQGLHIFPLRKLNGQIERLLSFTLEYTSHNDDDVRGMNTIPDYTENSVLSSGEWYKMGVTNTGVYKLTYSDLQQFGINPATIDPRKIRIFGNGNSMLPEANNLSRPDDLIENAIYVHGETDGNFGPDDYILFYGLSPVKVRYNSLTTRFDHQVNHYTDTTFYFLTVSTEAEGKRMQAKAQVAGTVSFEVTDYQAHFFHENDFHNLMSTGREWFGEEFSTGSPSLNLAIHFPNLITNRPVHIQTQFVGRSVTEHVYFNFTSAGQEVISMTELKSVTVNESLYARESVQVANFYAGGPQFDLQVNFHANNNGSRGWLNFIRLNAWCALQYGGGQFHFRNPAVTGTNNISRFNVTNAGVEARLWDVTDPLRPRIQQFNSEGQTLTFTTRTDTLREFVMFDNSQFLQIASAKRIPNQNLHAISDAEYLIVVHPRFMESAHELAAFHESFQGLNTIVVNIDEIYNEFGGGAADITAVRDFARMVYFRSNQNLKYLLLFGDASYDYKDRIHNNTNFVPTYQAIESLRETASWVTDDYFGLFGNDEGAMMAGTMDIGIGRFPVSNTGEADLMVQKVKHYMKPKAAVAGDWRNNITFMGDDQDNNLHFNQAESLSQIVDTARNILNISKVYLDAYPRQAIPGGFRYPDANKAIINQIESGALMVNYTGHGGVNGLTDERVITIPDIIALTNYDKMPLFITATCEFSRFDDPEFVSAGERLILNPYGGGIALMTTTRLAFAHSNFFLNRRIYMELFQSTNNDVDRLGDVLRRSKNPSNANIYNFVLLGDPAVKLATPSRRVKTTRFNNEILSRIDTISAMSVVSIRGEIVDHDGVLEDNFNGYIYPKVFDKQTTYRTLGNASGSSPAYFSYFDKVIHYGKATVTNGLFEFEFAVPKDIAYQYGKGRISYYAVDTLTFADASGDFSELIIGGIDSDVTPDNNGPQIELYVNHPNFKNGDLLKNEVVVYASISDPQGINHLGVGIGRDIMGYLNNSASTAYNLNGIFEPNIDTYTEGSLVFKLPQLENGEHHFRLKAWDLHNNSSEAEVYFRIDDKEIIQLSSLYNRPNPFSEQTQFVFVHNKAGETVDIQVEIFRIDGTKVSTLEAKDVMLTGIEFSLNWNGRDDNGNLLASGMYIYRFTLDDKKGYSIVTAQKMLISR